MKRLATIVLAAALCTGCGAMGGLIPALTTVISAITEAGRVLSAVDAAAQQYFLANPNPELQKEYGKALAKTELALSAAMRTVKGAEKLDQQKVDEAFAEFRKAYQELMAILGPYGIVAPSQDGTFGTAPNGTLMVPEPMALSVKVD